MEDFIQGWLQKVFSSRKLSNGKSFDELFQVDSIPLFWFYKRYLLKHVLPRPLNTYEELLEAKELTPLRQLQLQLSSLVIKKYLLFNERRKVNAAFRQSTKRGKKYTSAHHGQTDTPKAIFLTYPDHLSEENQLYRIQSIIDVLHQDALLEPFPLFVTPLSSLNKKSLQDFSSNYPDFCTIYHYCDEEIKLKAEQQAAQIVGQWKQLDTAMIAGGLKVNNHKLWPYLSPAFSLFMSKEFLFITLMYYEAGKKIIEEENVAITFISGQNGLLERCLAAASKTQGIPCMLVPHGYAIGNLPPQDVLDNMYLPIFNKKTADTFIKSGLSEKQFRVTGPAMYDNIVKYQVVKQRTKTAPGQNLLLLTQPLIEDNLISTKAYFKMVETVLKEILAIPGTSITIKLHPREKGIKRYQELAQRLEGGKIKSRRISIRQKGELNLLYRLLAEAKVVINFFATAGVLEASILDVPSITFPYNQKKSGKYGGFDPSLYVWERESLRPAIKKLLGNPSLLRKERQKMVKEFCTIIDGKSSERVAHWAYELVKK